MTMWKFYREPGAEPEEVPLERWMWVALYSDDSVLIQFDQKGVFHQFKEIDQSRLSGFQMVSNDGGKPIMIHWAPGYKLIHFYRNMRLRIGEPDEQIVKLYCFGYETPASKVIVAIMPDNSIRMLEDIDTLVVS
jgi:hypothetical protein